MKRLLLTLLAFALLETAVQGQDPSTVDSLLQITRQVKNDSNKVKAFLALSDLFENNEPEKAIHYCRQAAKLSNTLGYEKGTMSAYRSLAYVYAIKSKHDSLIYYSQLVYDIAVQKNDTFNMGVSFFNIGEGYKFLGDYERCIDYTFKALKILEGKGYHTIEPHLYSGLQSTYYKLKQYDRSIEYGLKGIELARKYKSENILMVLLENMGHCYTDTKQFTLANNLFDEAIDLAQKNNNKDVENVCYQGKVDIALQQKRYDDIRQYAGKTMQLSMALEDSSGLAISHHNLALYYFLTKDFNKAYEQEIKALAIAKANKYIEHQARILAQLSIISAAKHDIEGSMDFAKEFYDVDGKIFTDGVAQKDAEMRTLYDTEKKEDQIKLQQAQLDKKTTLNYFLAIGTLALAAILLLSYRNYKHSQKLQQLKIDELESEKQLAATAAVLKGEAQERTRLAKDLHDGLGGMLSGIKFSLNRVKGNLVMTPDNAQAFERSIDMLDSSIQEMRRVAHNMMPEMLLKYGLDTALKEFCSEIDRSDVMRITYQSAGINNVTLEQTLAVTVYRIVQELVSNALKHSNARTVLVQVHRLTKEKVLAITVEDDGIGFDPKHLNQSAGMGWQNIQSRVDFLKGRLDVQSSPGKGTSVMIEINIA